MYSIETNGGKGGYIWFQEIAEHVFLFHKMYNYINTFRYCRFAAME